MMDDAPLIDKGVIPLQPNRRNERIYMDYQASTPADPRVVAAMHPYWSENFGNPHSSEHEFGWLADSAIEDARSDIASLIGADSDELVFTSGATEANNLAILGVARAVGSTGRRIIISEIEHKCILAAARVAEREGAEVVRLPVSSDGFVSPAAVADAIDEQTALVSIMLVNNEIGTIQRIEEIGEICRAAGVLLHTDAAQALGVIPIDVDQLRVDLLSLSGHKAYGPKGIGALYVRRTLPIKLEPIIHGGGQEGALRSGTLPTPLCVGFGKACQILGEERGSDINRILKLRERLWAGLYSMIPEIALNGPHTLRHPGNLNVRFPNIQADLLIGKLQPSLAVSSGAACSSGIHESSHVLLSIGLSIEEAESSIRLSIGRFTSDSDIDIAIYQIMQAVTSIKITKTI